MASHKKENSLIKRIQAWDRKTSLKWGWRFDPKPEDMVVGRFVRVRRHTRTLVVGRDNFLSLDQTADALGLHMGPMSINLLINRGILDHCIQEDRTEGVTSESVSRELKWQNEASRWQKIKRRVAGFFLYV